MGENKKRRERIVRKDNCMSRAAFGQQLSRYGWIQAASMAAIVDQLTIYFLRDGKIVDGWNTPFVLCNDTRTIYQDLQQREIEVASV